MRWRVLNCDEETWRAADRGARRLNAWRLAYGFGCSHGADKLCPCGQCYCSQCWPSYDPICPDCRQAGPAVAA